MACEQFKEINFRKHSLALIRTCNEILASYDMRITLRQLYYRLVARNIVPNTEKSYKNVGGLVSDARLAGLINWNAIEDRVRQPRMSSEFSSLSDLAEAALRSWRLPRWEDQDHYVELWVEKDALSGVLRPLASEFHVTLMVNRGYSSQSAMFESAQRFIEAQRGSEGKQVHLLYVGDHDPSGEDMVRDVGDRLAMFGVQDLDVRKLALTMEQVQRYNPPPNPAKRSDSRFANYAAEHGATSWEVDAIEPPELQRIIRGALSDREKWDACLSREKKLARKFELAAAKIDG